MLYCCLVLFREVFFTPYHSDTDNAGHHQDNCNYQTGGCRVAGGGIIIQNGCADRGIGLGHILLNGLFGLFCGFFCGSSKI